MARTTFVVCRPSWWQVGLLLAALIGLALLASRTPPGLTTTVYNNTYADPYEFAQGIYLADHAVPRSDSRPLRAVIVPHHLVASELMAMGIKAAARQRPQQIMLVSPDHFHRCPNLACVTLGTFETFFGPVTSWQPGVAQAMRSPLVTNEPTLFHEEHGIFAVTPFIAHYAPGIPVIPLVISQDHAWTAQQKADMAALINQLMTPDTVLVVSSDFSHYLPLAQATDMDAATLQTILHGPLDDFLKLHDPSQSDCPRCLWLLGQAAVQNTFYNPVVFKHTNSAQLLGDVTAPSTTSHFAIGWYAGVH